MVYGALLLPLLPPSMYRRYHRHHHSRSYSSRFAALKNALRPIFGDVCGIVAVYACGSQWNPLYGTPFECAAIIDSLLPSIELREYSLYLPQHDATVRQQITFVRQEGSVIRMLDGFSDINHIGFLLRTPRDRYLTSVIICGEYEGHDGIYEISRRFADTDEAIIASRHPGDDMIVTSEESNVDCICHRIWLASNIAAVKWITDAPRV